MNNTYRDLISLIREDKVNPHVRSQWIKSRGSDPLDQVTRPMIEAQFQKSFLPSENILLLIIISPLFVVLSLMLDTPSYQWTALGGAFLLSVTAIILYHQKMSAWKKAESAIDQPCEFMEKLSLLAKLLFNGDPHVMRDWLLTDLASQARACLKTLGHELGKKNTRIVRSKENRQDIEPKFAEKLIERGDVQRAFYAAHELFTEFAIINEEADSFIPVLEIPTKTVVSRA